MLLLGALLIVYTLISLLLFWRIGLIPANQDIVFSTPDSCGYRVYADFLAGEGPRPNLGLIALRPILFPLYLSHYHQVGITGFILMQWLLNIVTLIATFLSIKSLTSSRWYGFVGVLVIILHPTFSFIALHALTETLTLALISLAVYQMVLFFRRRSNGSLFLSCLFLSLATCAKPTYLPFLMLWCLYATLQLIRSECRPKCAMFVAPLAVAPVVLQLAVVFVFTGNIAFSTAGTVNFQHRLFPAVYGFAHEKGFIAHSTPEAEDARIAYPELRDKLGFVVTHPYATAQATTYLLRHNLVSSSSFTSYPEELISDRSLSSLLMRVSGWINKVMFPIHFIGAVAVIVLLCSRAADSWLLLSLSLLSYSVFGLSVLTYWQGDRLILAALPVWTVLYALIVHKVPESPHIQSLTRAFKRLREGRRSRRSSRSA